MNEDNQNQGKDQGRSNVAKKEVRDSHAKVPPISINVNSSGNVNTSNPPDFINFKVTNPLVYIKYWWKRIMANEGIEMKLKVRPITVIAISVVAFSLAFGLGGVVFPFAFPWLKINNQVVSGSPTPTPQEWRQTALKGILKKSATIPQIFSSYLIR